MIYHFEDFLQQLWNRGKPPILEKDYILILYDSIEQIIIRFVFTFMIFFLEIINYTEIFDYFDLNIRVL